MIISALLTADFVPFDILCFSLALWLGAYLLKRNLRGPRTFLGGLGLLFYAGSTSCFILGTVASPIKSPLREIGPWLLLISLLLWGGALVVFGLSRSGLQARSRLVFISFLVLLVTIGISLVWYPHTLALLIICVALLVLGAATAIQDAEEQGEALIPDLFRSFDYAMITALVFGGQVALFMLFGIGATFPTLALLQTTLATAIIIQVFAHAHVKLLDTIAFATFPQLKQTRDELHTAIDVLPRIQNEVNLENLDETEFTRLTRRALSHLGDLPQLASNPLTRLPLIKAQLSMRGTKDEDVLESAAELKTLLTESIQRLKPRGNEEFGSSDEWRYYNALYFPYVKGIKPYSRRSHYPVSDAAADEALNWFRTQVPERTLHNWQNTAAKLIAQDIRNQRPPEMPKLQLSNGKSGRK